jgi:2'-5' RNA ligase
VRLGFGIILEDECHNYSRKLELELCEKFGFCCGLKQSPHITIKAPFEAEQLNPFVDYLEKLAKETSPFEIKLEGFNYFGNNVIFLDVKENQHLKDLHFKVLKDLKDKFDIDQNEFEGKNVKFHSTLATSDITERKFIEAKQYLEKYDPKFKFTAKTLGIFYDLGEDAGWIIVRRIKLSGSKEALE